MDISVIISIVLGIGGIISMLIVFWGKVSDTGSKGENIEGRIESLEEGHKEVAKDIKTIKENHLAHIQDDIGTIKVNLGEINTALKFIIKDK